jgi:hypothetical protein
MTLGESGGGHKPRPFTRQTRCVATPIDGLGVVVCHGNNVHGTEVTQAGTRVKREAGRDCQ